MIKNLSILSFFVVFTAVSCKKETTVISKKVIQQKIDSILDVRIKELDQEAQRDLEHRKTIELKVKSDSICQAIIKADTLQHKAIKK